MKSDDSIIIHYPFILYNCLGSLFLNSQFINDVGSSRIFIYNKECITNVDTGCALCDGRKCNVARQSFKVTVESSSYQLAFTR